TIRKITQAGAVTTLAGVAGAPGSADGTGSNARFNTPTGITADSTGFLYVADSGNQTIRGLNLYGVSFTVGGKAGVKGEANGVSTAARFNGPQSMVIDLNGNLIVADTYNDIIRFGALVTTATVYVAAVPASGGTVTGGGSYEIGTNVTLTAVANAGWTFSAWSDGTVSTSRTETIPPYDSWYTARFLPTLGVAADAPAFTWSTGGASAWSGELTASHDSHAAVQSGALNVGQTNWVQAVVTNGPGSLQFWWRLSSAAGDTLQFYINTQLVAQISGNANWSQYTTFLGSTNACTLKWVYIKNNPASSGSNAGWVDQVTLMPCAYAANVPQMFFQNTSGTLVSWVLNSTGTFQFSRLLGETGSWALKAAGDVNGDGVSDLLFQSPGGDTAGWALNADGSTRSTRSWGNTGNWEIKACADFEGRGNGQIFFQNTAGTVVYWRLDTNGNFLSAASVGNMGPWKLKAGGDLDGDGKAELFWQRADGMLVIWFRDTHDSIYGVVPYAAGPWLLRAVVDINADGVSDLLWQNPGGDTVGWFTTTAGAPSATRFWGNTGSWKLKAAGR
ncbi:MAG: hypothetical protein NTY53_16800, partial [Kiritimatiellaeota bacterium]|nr:hypothetical protein [Kiritimatiellota bacterium]